MSWTGRQSGMRCEMTAFKRGERPGTGSVLFMENRSDGTFTTAQYAGLTNEEREAIQMVAEYLLDDDLKVFDDKTLSKTFNLLRPCDGCVPDEEIGNDLDESIRRKFACVYSSALELAKKKLEGSFWSQKDLSFKLVVDPSDTEAITVIVTDYNYDEKPFCYFEDFWKCWHFEFNNLKEIAEEVLRARDEIISKFVSLAKERLRRAEEHSNRKKSARSK